MPEFGGPKVVLDNDVPKSWSNKVNKVSCAQAFFDHGIFAEAPLLAQDSSLDDNLLYLVEGESAKYYIWKPAFNEVSRIDEAEGLQDILDIFNDPSRHLTLSRIDLEY